jgi:hypothetical protein
MPEFLVNSSGLNLGVKQNGVRGKQYNALQVAQFVPTVDDVVLPPWAKTPEEFIRINKQVT